MGCVPSSRGSSQPRDRTCLSDISCTGRQFLTSSATWEAWVLRVAAFEPQSCLDSGRSQGLRRARPPCPSTGAGSGNHPSYTCHGNLTNYRQSACCQMQVRVPDSEAKQTKTLESGAERFTAGSPKRTDASCSKPQLPDELGERNSYRQSLGWGLHGVGLSSDWLVVRLRAGIARPEVTSLHCLGAWIPAGGSRLLCARRLLEEPGPAPLPPTVSWLLLLLFLHFLASWVSLLELWKV